MVVVVAVVVVVIVVVVVVVVAVVVVVDVVNVIVVVVVVVVVDVVDVAVVAVTCKLRSHRDGFPFGDMRVSFAFRLNSANHAVAFKNTPVSLVSAIPRCYVVIK